MRLAQHIWSDHFYDDHDMQQQQQQRDQAPVYRRDEYDVVKQSYTCGFDTGDVPCELIFYILVVCIVFFLACL